MAERPILFSGPMVRAILAGTKTQTRRPAPIKALSFTHHPEGLITWAVQFMKAVKGVLASYSGGSFTEEVARSIIASQFCPFGQPGDRLWVRETWAHYQTVNHRRCSDGRSFDEVSDGLAGYRADGHNTIEDFRNHIRLMSGCDLEAVLINGDRWRPSIHMPRWACRLVLEIVSVRVELVQEISEAEAIAEGMPHPSFHDLDCSSVPPTDHFRTLWDSIYAAKGQGWEANPWVWVVEFKRVEVPA